MLEIGKFKIHACRTGTFALDGGAMFGVIPKQLWEKTNPADAQNRIDMALRNMLVQVENRTILVDTGMGNKWSDKHKEMYRLDYNVFDLDESLKKINLSVNDITDVLLTHLHFDHTGGSTIKSGENLVPRFPNATYYVSKKNWNWANNPSEKDRASYLKDNFIPLFEAGKLIFIDDFSDLKIEGLSSFKSDGHTFGMLLPIFTDDGKTIVYCADLIPTSSHIPIPYVMGYDLQPLISMEEKRALLNRATPENWILFFEHDPFSDASKVILNEKGQFMANEPVMI